MKRERTTKVNQLIDEEYKRLAHTEAGERRTDVDRKIVRAKFELDRPLRPHVHARTNR
jgi:hypothetical protein